MGATHLSGPLHVGGVLVVDASGNIDAPVTTTNLTTSGTTTLGDDVADTTTVSGPLTVEDSVVMDATTTSSGAAAVAITGYIHEISTTGTGDAMTLVDGTEGQKLTVVYAAEAAGGDTAILTPTSLAGASTTVTFNAIGDTANLLFTASDWYVMGGSAVVA
jgi:hypothetical protein